MSALVTSVSGREIIRCHILGVKKYIVMQRPVDQIMEMMAAPVKQSASEEERTPLKTIFV